MRVNSMSDRQFHHFHGSLNALTPLQLITLRQALDYRIAPPRPAKAKQSRNAAEEIAFDVASRAGVVG